MAWHGGSIENNQHGGMASAAMTAISGISGEKKTSKASISGIEGETMAL